eukprot:s3684_g1.t1
MPGPRIKPLQHDSAALQKAVRANSPQPQRMLDWVTEHLDLDSSPQAWDELLIGATERSMPQLEPAKLARHIASIKPGKAVPKGSAPAAAWKLCAQPVSQALARYCTSLDTQQHLDDGLTRADLCLIPKPGKPADKPSQLRPQGYCPDAKGLAGTAKELLEPLTMPYMQPLPQFAYLPGRASLRLKVGWFSTALKGGITFALDLSQAFDTGDHQDVETTTRIKQGCKLAPTLFSVLTGRLLHSLINTFGWNTVQKFFTGYADDFTMHRTIRNQADLAAAHKLILHLLDAVKALKLKVNQAKCAMLVKLSGREALKVLQKHTCWLPDTDRVLQPHWRCRRKSWPAYRWEAQIKLRVWFTTVWATLVTGLPEVCVTLQQACAAWYNHIYQRALAWAPDILPVVIARWTDGVKNIRPLEPPYVGRSGLTHDPLHMATDIVAALKDHADNVQAGNLGQTVGRGHTCRVYLSRDDPQYVIKQVQPEHEAEFRTELSRTCKLPPLSVINTIHAADGPRALMPRLWPAPKGLDGDTVQRLKFDISAALQMLHSAQIVHADVHADSVMLLQHPPCFVLIDYAGCSAEAIYPLSRGYGVLGYGGDMHRPPTLEGPPHPVRAFMVITTAWPRLFSSNSCKRNSPPNARRSIQRSQRRHRRVEESLHMQRELQLWLERDTWSQPIYPHSPFPKGSWRDSAFNPMITVHAALWRANGESRTDVAFFKEADYKFGGMAPSRVTSPIQWDSRD